MEIGLSATFKSYWQNLEQAPLFLLDAPIYAFRAWFAVQEAPSEQQYLESALLIFTRHLQKLLREYDVQYMVASFDESLGLGFRHKLFEDYKAQRPRPDALISRYLSACKQVLELAGVKHEASEQYESDDLIATLQKQWFSSSSAAVIILSRDKDLCQLVLDRNACSSAKDALAQQAESVWYNALFDNKSEYLDAQAVRQKFSVNPEQIPDFLALKGDAIDGIVGVSGVGDKSAAALLKRCGSLENLIVAVNEAQQDQVGPLFELRLRSKEKIISAIYTEQERLNKNVKLTRLVNDIEALQSCYTCQDHFALDIEAKQSFLNTQAFTLIKPLSI